MLEEYVCMDVGVLFVLQQEATDTTLQNQRSLGRKRLPSVETNNNRTFSPPWNQLELIGANMPVL